MTEKDLKRLVRNIGWALYGSMVAIGLVGSIILLVMITLYDFGAGMLLTSGVVVGLIVIHLIAKIAVWASDD
jgi:hypothetical protein